MKPRIKPIKLKIIAVIFIDVLLFSLLVLAGYAFFSIPARAENVDPPTDTSTLGQTFASELSVDGTTLLEINNPEGKVFVCKYVGTPGVDERLQTGDNPISVSINAIPDYHGIGSWFADAQDRSYVLVEDVGQPEPPVTDCPQVGIPTPTTPSTATFTPTFTSTPTHTQPPTATPTKTQPPTATPSPTGTVKVTPTLTNTTKPSATNTLVPSPTNTVKPSATNTHEPSPTSTIRPSATNTLEPSPTSTIKPSATSTHISHTPTITPKPSASPTHKPTYTQTGTITPSQTQSPTITQTPTAIISTEVITCPACYIVKDFREMIVSGLYNADLRNTEDISSTFKVSITLFDVYKGMVVGKTIDMVDTQPAGEVMQVQTPLWCINPVADDVYWIHTVASAQKSSGEIWFALDEWVRINLKDGIIKNP